MKYPNNIPQLSTSATANFTFAGIGSRKTPEAMQRLLYKICNRLVGIYKGRLLSGNAEGADWACQEGASQAIKEFDMCLSHSHIFLPYEDFGFNKHPEIQAGYYVDVTQLPTYERAKEFAIFHHPKGDELKDYQIRFHARNAYQVHSWNLRPTSVIDFIVCWTPDGAEHTEDRPVTSKTGGTGQALRYAYDMDVPIFNIANEDAIQRLYAFLSQRSFI